MTKGNDTLHIPLKRESESQINVNINGLIATINNLQESLIARIDRVENSLKEVKNKEIPNYDKDVSDIKKDLGSIKKINLILDEVKNSIVKNITKNNEETFSHNFNNLVGVLDESISSYVEDNKKLLEKFQIIEHNTHSNIESLKNIVQHQIYDPLDYLYIKEQFNVTNKNISDVYNILNILVKDREVLKRKNPYICEVIHYKDLPVAEFSNYTKSVVYRYGKLFKRIAFFKNDGKNWIRIK